MKEGQTIQEATDEMWAMLSDTMEYYNSVSCQCAFPRFRQYAAIDCVDYAGSFYMSETEGFIYLAQKYFDITPVSPTVDANNSIYTCKKCGSTFYFGWQDFSIHVNRSVLKPQELKVTDVGAPAKQPIPFVIGLFGHKYPDRSLFDKVTIETFKEYLQALN
jgi:hypothetical protein